MLKPLCVLFAPNINVRGLILVKEVVKLVVGGLHSVHLLLLMVLDRCVIVAMRRVMHHYVLVTNVWRRLLVALVVADG